MQAIPALITFVAIILVIVVIAGERTPYRPDWPGWTR